MSRWWYLRIKLINGYAVVSCTQILESICCGQFWLFDYVLCDSIHDWTKLLIDSSDPDHISQDIWHWLLWCKGHVKVRSRSHTSLDEVILLYAINTFHFDLCFYSHILVIHGTYVGRMFIYGDYKYIDWNLTNI